MSQEVRLNQRLFVAVTPTLKQAFEARARAMNMDPPALMRLAIAMVAERGIDFGPKNSPVNTGKAGG